MNCETIKPLLSEFADERLEAATAWLVQTHISECEDCRRVSHDLTAMRRLLQTLPTRQPSAQFDAALAQRLAMTRRPEKQASKPLSWRDTLAGLFALPRFRPALALGLVLSAGAVVAWFPMHPAPPVPAPTALHGADPAFIADCVAQRRRDAAGEPLADFSAQNLAGHLDTQASDTSASDLQTSADTAGSNADASIF